MTRAYDDDEWLIDTYGLTPTIGTVGTVGADKPLPKGWKPPEREFPIGFHVAAPGPSHPDPDPEPARKPRKRAARAGANAGASLSRPRPRKP